MSRVGVELLTERYKGQNMVRITAENGMETVFIRSKKKAPSRESCPAIRTRWVSA
jgi:hypothetical protein